MPGWLWDTVFQYPLAEGDTRTQYADGSTYVGPLKDGMRHGKGAYFFQDGSRWVSNFYIANMRRPYWVGSASAASRTQTC